MTVAQGGTRYQKQRLVLFDLAGREVVDGPEGELDEKGKELPGVQHHIFRDVGLYDHLRRVFFQAFPMDRFYTVQALAQSPANLVGKDTVSSDAMIGGAEADPFAAYSLACADWVGMPRVIQKEAAWQKVKKKKIVNGQSVDYLAWQVQVTWALDMDVFRREVDGWKRVSTIEGSNGGLLGVAFGLAAGAAQGQSGSTKASPLSERPVLSCVPSLLPKFAAVQQGLTACGQARADLQSLAASIVGGEADDGAEKGTEDGSQDSPEPATPATPVEPGSASEVSTAPPVESTPETLPEAGATNAEGEAPAEPSTIAESPPPITDDELAALRVAAEGDLAAIKHVAALAAKAKHPRVQQAAALAHQAVEACTGMVGALARSSQDLRSLGQARLPSPSVQTVLGFAACAGISLGFDLGDAVAPGTSTLHSSLCEGIQDDVALGQTSMRAVAVCDGRTAMEQSTLALQKEGKNLDGWKLFAVLQGPAPGWPRNVFGIALGRDEGVRRGDLYVAVIKQPDGREVEEGFGRILWTGPGGASGEADPSAFKFRVGSADPGTRMTEHAQIGVPLGLRPQVDLYTSKGDLDSSLAFGGALVGGYNASAFVPIGDEFWSKIYVSYESGGSGESFVTIELTPEVLYYLVDYLAAFGAVGPAYVIASKSGLDATSGATADASDEKLSGGNTALLLSGGLDFAIGADVSARAAVAYRQGLYSAKLTSKSKTASIDGGTLSALQLGLSGVYVF